MLTRYVPKVCFIYVTERIFIYFSAALTNVEDILLRNNQWKKKELKKLSETVQHKIYAVQVSFYFILIRIPIKNCIFIILFVYVINLSNSLFCCYFKKLLT